MIVLLVDDEPAILVSTKLLLEHMGHVVHATSTPSEVLPLIEAHRPNVLIQDVRMPGLDLARLLDAIRASPTGSQVRIALFSASMELDEVASALSVEHYIEKPFDLQQLASAIGE